MSLNTLDGSNSAARSVFRARIWQQLLDKQLDCYIDSRDSCNTRDRNERQKMYVRRR